MAIAPVNKFINIAVPVAPNKQKLYEVPTGTSALLLYLQVANVGIGTTFPKVTFTQQRTQRSTGNKREVRVIKDIEIPPNDAAIIVDGRLVLEKTPLVLDKIFIEGTQQQVGIITFVDYHEPTGVATITTKEPHAFSPGDPVTLAGIAFTCKPGQTGITTNIFPDPQQSYTVESIEGQVGTSMTFTSHIGGSTPLGLTNTTDKYAHYFNSAIHYYERSRRLPIEVVTTSGSLTSQVTKTAAAGTTYDPVTGILSVTANSHGFSSGDLVRLKEEGFAFTCASDGHTAVKKYPRVTGTGINAGKADYAYSKLLEITVLNANQFTMFIGTSSDTSIHTFVPGQSLANNVIKIGSRFDIEYAIYYGGGNKNVGYTSNDEAVIEGKLLRAGELLIRTSTAHNLLSGDKIRIIDNGLYFTCTMDNRETEHSYPRVTDPASGAELTIGGGTATSTNHLTTTQFVVNVGPSYSGGYIAPLEMELIASILENSTA